MYLQALKLWPWILINEWNYFFLCVLINDSISGKSFASLCVSAHGCNQIRVLYFLIQIADKASSCHVRWGYFIDRSLNFFPGNAIHYRNITSNTAYGEYLFDSIIVLLWADKRQDKPFLRIPFVAVKYFHCSVVKGYADRLLVFPFCFGRNVFHRPINDVAFGKPHQIRHTATDATLKNKNISLGSQCRTSG